MRRLHGRLFYDMESRALSIKAGWLLSLRLTTYVLIAGIVIYWLRYPDFLSFPFFAYSFLTLLLPILYYLRKKTQINLLLKAIPVVQILCEVVIECGIIYSTGNIASAFSGLFILTIISAAFVTNLVGILGMASLISLSYSFVVWLGLTVDGSPGSSIRALETMFSSEDAAFYNIFLHILTFYLVAFISGFLVERLKTRDQQLADTSQALKRARLETDDILKHLNSGLLTVDKDCRVIFFNRGAEEILGFDEAETKGRDFKEIFRNRAVQLANKLQEVLDTRKGTLRGEIEIVNQYGCRVPVGVSTSLLLEDDGNIRGVIAIFQDLTDTKKLEEKIRMADKMAAVGELSAAIAHEIRNPLAAISGSVEILRNEIDVSGENRRLMNLIDKESSRLNNILTDFLLYARSQRVSFVKVELCHLVGEVIEMVKHHPSYKDNISISMISSESLEYIFGDEDHLKQILINLVVNACEAIDDMPGEIVIQIESNNESGTLLKVMDNGPGMEEAFIGKIFTPFFSTKNNGTGLGLAIVQRLSGNLNISLSCESEIGRGTTFSLQFRQFAERTAIPSSQQKTTSIT